MSLHVKWQEVMEVDEYGAGGGREAGVRKSSLHERGTVSVGRSDYIVRQSVRGGEGSRIQRYSSSA